MVWPLVTLGALAAVGLAMIASSRADRKGFSRDVGIVLLTGVLIGGAVFWAEQNTEDRRAEQAQLLEDQRAEQAQLLEDERAKQAQVLADERAGLDRALADERAQLAEVLENTRFVRQLAAGQPDSVKPFGGLNLSGAELAGLDLSGADLIGADLSGADLSRADLSKANLAMANLQGASLLLADLSGANLTLADLSGASLSSGGNLLVIATIESPPSLDELRFTGALLTSAVFGDVADLDLLFVDFTDACWEAGRPPWWPEVEQPPLSADWCRGG